MKNLSHSRQPRRNQGVALVLVLCFVVLITGLVVAYFSRTLTTRQLSNASTSTAQAEMLANSATDIIISDFKQEIANGSIAATPPPAALPAGNTVYVPAIAVNAVPQRNPSPAPTPGTIPNLVRRSLYDDAVGGANAAPSPAPTPGSRASNASSDKVSANGRSISLARWNRHYLIPTATPNPSATPSGPSNSLTASTPITDFKAPNWVFVTAEKGPDVLTSPFKDSAGTAVTATGRYAYAVYDEGGLLDVNYAGFPSTSSIKHIGAKPAPSYADLTQLPTPPPRNGTSTPLTSTDVDRLLGWRNYATLQSTGTFPALQPATSLADAAYFSLFTSNPAAPTPNVPNPNAPNLLKVPLAVWNNDKTDQMFLSRQQLINYFAAAKLDPSYLQYFGTFSRSLNQPSYLPEHSATALLPTNPANLTPDDDPFRRPVKEVPSTPGTGENNAYGNFKLNPNFLAARVVNTFKRYDQTDAIVGEPLVKKRFPLNRLAWLTYRGPSHDRNTSATDITPGTADADIGYLKQNGITKEWLDQGTADNIKRYFGLQWNGNTDKWSYIHGSNGSNGAILNVDNPDRANVVGLTGTAAREPDFFELLKASINPGSIAKPSLSPQIVARDNLYHGPKNQYLLDSSLDTAILQIGANIIDQFDTDGFPIQIHYDLLPTNAIVGKLPFVCGDENVPYISRVHSGLLHLAESDPPSNILGTNPPAPLKDTGLAVLMNYPVIWNLHDWNSNNLAQSVGAVAPKKFKIFAKANDNGDPKQATTIVVWNQEHVNSCDANTTLSPGFGNNKYGFSFGASGSGQGGEARYLTETNTRMTFSLDPADATSEALFREPTMLFQPNLPRGSSLASDALASTNNGLDGLGNLAKNSNFFASGPGGGLISTVDGTTASKVPRKGAAYIGFYIGAEPLRFWYVNPADGTNTNSPHYQTQYGPLNDIVYTLACEDGSGGWINYDVKQMTTNGAPNSELQKTLDSGSGFNGTVGNAGHQLDYGLRYYQTIDPRTSRFGMFDPWIADNGNSIPPRENLSIVPGGGLSTSNTLTGTLKTDREGVNSGTALYTNFLSSEWFPGYMGWFPSNVAYSTNGFRPGLLEQNNPHATPNGVVAPLPLPAGTNSLTAPDPFFYADPDGVVRRAMGGNVDNGLTGAPASANTGLPLSYAVGTTASNSSGSGAKQMDSRPSILNRPFRSVAELGYVYSGTPWKNLDFFMPESGNSALLDVFCITDTSDGSGLTAGQVNLNTHQVPVLQAILAQTSKDQWNDQNTPTAASHILGTPSGGAAQQAQQLAQLLVTRTTKGVTSPTGTNAGPNAGAGPQPLQNVGDLVGRWVKPVPISNTVYDGNASCDGFTRDIVNSMANPTNPDPMRNIQRFGESAVRALSNAGQTRVWNLMFDIVAQTGRFGNPNTKSLDQFNVEGEQHYWVHVAIDRYTGQVLDKQVEVVKE